MNEQHLEPLKPHPEGRALRAEVDLGRIARNLERIHTVSGGRGVWGVVKANAYGHGAVPVGRALEQAGVHGLAVSSLEEGLELRGGGIGCPILVLGGLRPEALPAACAENLTIAVVGPEHLEDYARLLPRHHGLDPASGVFDSCQKVVSQLGRQPQAQENARITIPQRPRHELPEPCARRPRRAVRRRQPHRH